MIFFTSNRRTMNCESRRVGGGHLVGFQCTICWTMPIRWEKKATADCGDQLRAYASPATTSLKEMQQTWKARVSSVRSPKPALWCQAHSDFLPRLATRLVASSLASLASPWWTSRVNASPSSRASGRNACARDSSKRPRPLVVGAEGSTSIMMLMCIVHDIITGSKKDAYIYNIFIYKYKKIYIYINNIYVYMWKGCLQMVAYPTGSAECFSEDITKPFKTVVQLGRINHQVDCGKAAGRKAKTFWPHVLIKFSKKSS